MFDDKELENAVGEAVDMAGHRAIGLIQAAAANIHQDDTIPRDELFRATDEASVGELRMTCAWLATNCYRLIQSLAALGATTPDVIIGLLGDALIEREAERDRNR